eukprot:7617368-Pyramimonas_sp.AAC.1
MSEWAGVAGVVVTIDAPMSLDKSLLEPAAAPDATLFGATGGDGDGDVLDLRGRLSTVCASKPIPQMFLIGARGPYLPCQQAHPADVPYRCAGPLPSMPASPSRR